MEPKKSHDMLSTSWSPGEHMVQFQSESGSLRLRRTDGQSSRPSPESWEPEEMMQVPV